MSNQKSFFWVFTINNPEGDKLPAEWPDVQYALWQKEQGDKGTAHFQGYVAFKKRKELTWLKRHCSIRAHWELRKGSHDQAKHYNSKPHDGCACKHCTDAAGQRLDGPWVAGEELEEWGSQGKRNDLKTLKRRLDEGASEREIATDDETFPVWAKYYKVVQRYKMLLRSNERDWATYTIVYWGPSGVGKSRRALQEAGPGAYWLPKPESNGMVWWDGYDGQETVVIDEFYGWIQRDKMQRLCDRYPMLVQTKNGTTPFLATKIIITSNDHPTHWWPKVGIGAMARRLTGDLGRIVEMTPEPLPELIIGQSLGCNEVLAPSPALEPMTPDTLEAAFYAAAPAVCCDRERCFNKYPLSGNVECGARPLSPNSMQFEAHYQAGQRARQETQLLWDQEGDGYIDVEWQRPGVTSVVPPDAVAGPFYGAQR